MVNINPLSRLIASARVAFEGITDPVDRLMACVLGRADLHFAYAFHESR